MKHIPLSRGLFAIIDDEDFELVSRFKWHVSVRKNIKYAAHSYHMGFVGGRHLRGIIYLHQLIIRPQKGLQVDHVNHDGLNNCRDNLRVCTRSQNIMNSRTHVGMSRYKGVNLYVDGRWCAGIVIDGKRRYIGYFAQEVDAAIAYNEAARKHFGKFACLNEVTSC